MDEAGLDARADTDGRELVILRLGGRGGCQREQSGAGNVPTNSDT
jgi:hypothetical protein